MFLDDSQLKTAVADMHCYYISFGYGKMPQTPSGGFILDYPMDMAPVDPYPQDPSIFIPKGIPSFNDSTFWDEFKKIPDDKKKWWFNNYFVEPPNLPAEADSVVMFLGVVPQGEQYYEGFTLIRKANGDANSFTTLLFSSKLTNLVAVETIYFTNPRKTFVAKVMEGLKPKV